MKQILWRSSLTQVSPPSNLSCKQINCSKHCFDHATDLIPTFWIKWKHLNLELKITYSVSLMYLSRFLQLLLSCPTHQNRQPCTWLASVCVWTIQISESSHVLTFSQLIWCFLKFQDQVPILTRVYGLSWFTLAHDDLLNSVYTTNIQTTIHIKLCNIFYFDMYIVPPQLHFNYLLQRTCLVFLCQSLTVSSY